MCPTWIFDEGLSHRPIKCSRGRRRAQVEALLASAVSPVGIVHIVRRICRTTKCLWTIRTSGLGDGLVLAYGALQGVRRSYRRGTYGGNLFSCNLEEGSDVLRRVDFYAVHCRLQTLVRGYVASPLCLRRMSVSCLNRKLP